MPEDKFAKIFEGKYSEHIQYIPIFGSHSFKIFRSLKFLNPKFDQKEGEGV